MNNQVCGKSHAVPPASISLPNFHTHRTIQQTTGRVKGSGGFWRKSPSLITGGISAGVTVRMKAGKRRFDSSFLLFPSQAAGMEAAVLPLPRVVLRVGYGGPAPLGAEPTASEQLLESLLQQVSSFRPHSCCTHSAFLSPQLMFQQHQTYTRRPPVTLAGIPGLAQSCSRGALLNFPFHISLFARLQLANVAVMTPASRCSRQ